MNRIVLAEIPIPVGMMYMDGAVETVESMVRLAMKSPKVKWANANRCKVKSTIVFDDILGIGTRVIYTALSDELRTEFALRF